jgi:hypothetical protein
MLTVTARLSASIGDENAAPLEQGAAPCNSDATSSKPNHSKNVLPMKQSACG